MRPWLLATALLGLAPLPVLRAEDAATYPLDTWRVTWRAGDRATVHAEETVRGTIDVTAPNPETGEVGTQKTEMSQKDVFTFVVECLEADAKGDPLRSRVFVREWSHTETRKQGDMEQGGDPNTSLKGVHLEVVAKDGAHAYTVLTPGAKPSDEAVKWLEKKFGKHAKERSGLDLDRLGRPAAPVKVGDSWAGDPTQLDLEGGVDAEHSTVKLTLAEVKDGRMRLPVQMRVRLLAFPLGEGASELPFTEGGAFEADAVITHSMAPGTFDSTGQFKGSMTGTAAQEGALTLKIDLRFQMQGESRTGGELPPVPAPK